MEWFQTYQKVVMIRFVMQLFVIEIVPKQLIVIHPVDELNMMEELGQIATFADMQYKLTI